MTKLYRVVDLMLQGQVLMQGKEEIPIFYPDNIFEYAPGESMWWVARTKSRHEKALAKEMIKRDIHYFLPLWEKIYFKNKRKRMSKLPLFPGYLFFRGDVESRYAVYTTNSVAAVIEVKDQEKLHRELEQINRVLAIDTSVEPYPELTRGTWCRIKKGPFIGLEGTVVRKKNQYRIILEVSTLGMGASLEIDGEFLEPLE